MTKREEALRALESRDWTGAVVDDAKRQTSIVYSVRVDQELSEWIAAESERRGVSPSLIIRDALTEAKAAQASDETVTLKLSDLHRAVNRLVQPIGYRTA
ncbi:ribbon-helix-helix domain-containing protein [Glycomyces luteolus]|uniref:Ribbon-helix-helix domain-containing protein n=1 Tax=Glycomyces luteolus TaxID=2670330 RepID=A0A9X3PBY8_9ACTN|nr:CopG family transcriptional regulator [Glycomyces luteolus]MDA1361944.1 ribbon-helix-helix domain-containing protein [Glycomyces luteolus]